MSGSDSVKIDTGYRRPTPADIEQVRKSDLFDANWYLNQYQDVKILNMDPAEHYLWLGWHLKRNPSPRFDTAGYLAANADVAKAGINPLLHYLKWGSQEGRGLKQKSVPASPAKASTNVGSAGREAKPSQSPAGPAKPAVQSRVLPVQTPKAAAMPTSAVVAQAVKAPAAKTDNRSKEYEVIEAAFDRAYYLRRYLDIANARIDPVKHYIEYGGREGRDPSPEFVTKYYVNRYPDVAQSGVNPFYHYLTIGKVEGRGATPFSAGERNFDTMCEMLGRSPKEVENELIERRRDLRQRLENGILGEMLGKAGELEPLVHHSWLAAINARFPPFHSESIVGQVAAMYRLQKEAGFRRAKAVIATRSGGVSGTTRIAGHLATALSDIYGQDNVVVITTQNSDPVFPGWFPDRVRFVDLAAAAQGLAPVEQQKLLVEFLRSLRPAVAFNVNSRLFWEMMKPYGKALSASIALYGYHFCNDVNIFGDWDGYPARQFYRCFDILEATITDSRHLADDLQKKFQVPPAQSQKLVVLDTPIDKPFPLMPIPKATGNRRPQIFWAGRFDRQKRIDIVAALATRLSDLDFRLWGEPVLDNDFRKIKLPSNIILEGVYQNFADLPLSQCDLWLYTSQWDGVPNVLFEVAATGVPLVGSTAGGCGEVLLEGLCERIADVEDLNAFEAAIRRVLADPAAARKRAARLRERMLKQRNPQVYRAAVEKLLPGKVAT